LGALEKLSKWGESTAKPVVLALDEAQEFMLFPKFDSLLAYIYDSFNGVKLVMSGSKVGVGPNAGEDEGEGTTVRTSVFQNRDGAPPKAQG
jgi:hypothetical protein